ncbi:MAG: hypothetical protein IKR05_14695 [Prevotella sp.]|nr:hypothetical protein [Prevotella sp.]
MPQRSLSDRQKSDGEAFLRIFPSEHSILAYFAPIKWPAAIANADKSTAFSEMTLNLLDATYTQGLAARIVENNIRGLYTLGRPHELINDTAVRQAALLFVGKYGTELSVFGTLLYFAQYLTNHKSTYGQFDLVDILRQCEKSFLPQWRKRLAKKEEKVKDCGQCREVGKAALYSYLRRECVDKGIDLRNSPIVQLGSFSEQTLRFIESGEPLTF